MASLGLVTVAVTVMLSPVVAFAGASRASTVKDSETVSVANAPSLSVRTPWRTSPDSRPSVLASKLTVACSPAATVTVCRSMTAPPRRNSTDSLVWVVPGFSTVAVTSTVLSGAVLSGAVRETTVRSLVGSFPVCADAAPAIAKLEQTTTAASSTADVRSDGM